MNTNSDVLVVDDDRDLLETIRRTLNLFGYDVRCATNGNQALAAVAQKMPAVILLDMLMPALDGWDCAKELRARYGRSVPIVVVTAAEHAQLRADQVGVDAVLGKPFDLDDLLDIVERFASKKRVGTLPR